ncbi:MAG: molybdopterin-synthase adenylyltransferase MoeB [bacterium]
MTPLSQEEAQRYARHLILPEVGKSGQECLKSASVLLIGAGGLGSPMALYLAAAGVGHLGIVDFDVVDVSNLQRQILHGESTLGQTKLNSAKKRLKDLNPFIHLTLIEEPLTSDNALSLFKDYDVIADGTDNFPTRYLVNDACVLSHKPNVYASIFRFEGQLSVFNYQDGPCYRCVYPEPPPPGLVPSCAEGGVLGVLPGVMGSLQANEVLKVILDIGDVASKRLVLYDALKLRFRELKLKKDPQCPICSQHPTQTQLIDYQGFCGISADSTTESEPSIPSMLVKELATLMNNPASKTVLIDVREAHERDICTIEGSIWVPLNQVDDYFLSCDKHQHYIIHCKSGGRSAKVVQLLRNKGFDACNLHGGIMAWAHEIDPSMLHY